MTEIIDLDNYVSSPVVAGSSRYIPLDLTQLESADVVEASETSPIDANSTRIQTDSTELVLAGFEDEAENALKVYLPKYEASGGIQQRRILRKVREIEKLYPHGLANVTALILKYGNSDDVERFKSCTDLIRQLVMIPQLLEGNPAIKEQLGPLHRKEFKKWRKWIRSVISQCLRLQLELPRIRVNNSMAHPQDFVDPDSPTGHFSFNRFVANLRLDLIYTYLPYLDLPDRYKILHVDFESQILMLYKASKESLREMLIERVCERFEAALLHSAQSVANASLLAADTMNFHEPVANRLHQQTAPSGKCKAYLLDRSLPEVRAFANYSIMIQKHCITMQDEVKDPALVMPPGPIALQTLADIKRTPTQSSQLEHFLDEVRLDKLDGHDQGTAQEVTDAAFEVGAVPLADDKYTLAGLFCSLHPHQVLGIAWMCKREQEKEDSGKRSQVRGGLLADAMGLGKTVQTLGLMVKHRAKGQLKGGPHVTLIVCPVALIRQWALEIENKAPGLFAVHLHHGSTKLKKVSDISQYDVVITSYGTLAKEYPSKKRKRMPADDITDGERIERTKGPLFRLKFWRVVLDEAHIIKNPGAKVSIACCNLDADRHWCLTGTPFQNKVDDIYPILCFLGVPYFLDRKHFREEISQESNGAEKLRGVLAPYLMRRNKDDLIAGKKVLTLPEKHIECKVLELDPDEKALYKQVSEQMISEINKYLQAGTAVKKINHMFTMILRLRQLCIHPFLILEHLAAKNGLDQADFVRSGNGVNNVHLLATHGLNMTASGEICAVCSNELVDPVYHDGCDHHLCRTCSPQTGEQDESVCPLCSGAMRTLSQCYDPDDFPKLLFKDESGSNKRPSSELRDRVDSNALIPRTRTIPAVQQTQVPEIISLGESSEEELPTLDIRTVTTCKTEESAHKPSAMSPMKRPLEASSSKKSLDKSLTKIESFRSPIRRKAPSPSTSKMDRVPAPLEPKPQLSSIEDLGSHSHKPRYSADPADLGGDERAAPPTKAERAEEEQSWQELMKLDFVPSTKLTAVENKLREWMTMDGSKLIIFSQFVKALDLVDKLCELNCWDTLRYQGNMNLKERDMAITRFEDMEGPRILLMSLKAGGVGLNLVCANKVIMLDFWWNAAAEHQAVDRCHRFGQTKEVAVIRMYLPGTIEEKILQLQEAKLRTAGLVLGEDESGGKMAPLDMQDVLGLFGRITTNADGVQQIEASR